MKPRLRRGRSASFSSDSVNAETKKRIAAMRRKRRPADSGNLDDNETSTSDNNMVHTEEESLVGNADAKKGDMSPEVDLKTEDLKLKRSAQRDRRKRRRNMPSSPTFVTSPALSIQGSDNSSLSSSTELDSSGENSIATSATKNMASSPEDSNNIGEGACSSPVPSEVFPDTFSDLAVVETESTCNTRYPKRKEETNAHGISENDQRNLRAISSYSFGSSEMSELLERNKIDTSFTNKLYLNVQKEHHSSVNGVNDTLANRHRIALELDSSCQTEEINKKENGQSLKCAVEQIREDISDRQQQCIESSEADSPDNVFTLKKNGRKSAEHAIQDQKEFAETSLQKNGHFSDQINNSQKMFVSSGSGSLDVSPTECKERTSLPPSPIRGVIDNFASSDLPNKNNDPPDSLGEGSFSFQIVSNAIKDMPSGSCCSEEKYALRQEVQTQNMKTSIYECGASDTLDLSSGFQKDENNESSSMNQHVQDVSSLDVVKDQDKHLDMMTMTPERAITSTRKKLLVLDLNGLLADIALNTRDSHRAYKVGIKSVFKRPFYEDFLKFGFEMFNIGVWSSRRKYNVDAVIEILMGDDKNKLLFCWDQSKCTNTGYPTIENVHKPLVLKELRKLWNKEEPDLPWELGEYGPANTLLVDDSPYKALGNPPHTGIFPPSYNFDDEKDNSLGPGGDLRLYLEGLAMADNVQHYVQGHPFGQVAITEKHPNWSFYLQVVEKLRAKDSSAVDM